MSQPIWFDADELRAHAMLVRAIAERVRSVEALHALLFAAWQLENEAIQQQQRRAS